MSVFAQLRWYSGLTGVLLLNGLLFGGSFKGMIRLDQAAAGKIVTLTFKGSVGKYDYKLFVPQLEDLLTSTAKITTL